jgi:hypothetical protein
MAGVEKLTAEKVIQALEQHQGLAALAAQSLGVALQTVYNYRDRYPTVAARMKELRERRTDHVELRLYDRINSGDTTAIIFYLKTQAKDRGYVERQEVTGKDGGPVQSLDMSKLTSSQLERLARGEDVSTVLANPGAG